MTTPDTLLPSTTELAQAAEYLRAANHLLTDAHHEMPNIFGLEISDEAMDLVTEADDLLAAAASATPHAQRAHNLLGLFCSFTDDGWTEAAMMTFHAVLILVAVEVTSLETQVEADEAQEPVAGAPATDSAGRRQHIHEQMSELREELAQLAAGEVAEAIRLVLPEASEAVFVEREFGDHGAFLCLDRVHARDGQVFEAHELNLADSAEMAVLESDLAQAFGTNGDAELVMRIGGADQ